MEERTRRLAAAKAGRKYLAGETSYKAIQDDFGDDEDELIRDLIFYIEHEAGPPMKLFWGLEFGSRKAWEQSRREIEEAIVELETAASNV